MVEGRDFLFIILYAPVQIIFSIYFLYHILGWRFVIYATAMDTSTHECHSAVIGMTVMILSFPIPGKVAHLVNNVQVSRMKKVRVDLCFVWSF